MHVLVPVCALCFAEREIELLLARMSICSPEPYNSARDLQIALLSLFELEILLVPRARIANVDSSAK
jgi:hypothetical protein